MRALIVSIAMFCASVAGIEAAPLVATTNGNLTSSGSWSATITTGNLVSTSTSSTALTTGTLDSATFVLTATTVQGFVVRLASRAAGTPTNTITMTLRNSTTATNTCSVTANVSSLPAADTTNDQGGWHFFKCPSTFTPNGTDSYLVRATLSATSTAVSLSTDGTANNWQRLVVTTTAAAPSAGDDMVITEVLDGATNPATVTARSITMDSTAATDYGAANTSTRAPAVSVSKGGTLSYGTTGSTNYVLRLSGHLYVYSGGTFNIGASGAEIPRTSTAVLEFDCAVTNNFGLSIGDGTVNMYGLSRTSGKNVTWTYLTANAAVAATALTVNDDTGWLSGDDVVVTSTSRTPSAFDLRTLNANATTSGLAFAAGLTNAHGGVAPVQAEVVNLTRNVIVRSTLSSAYTFVTPYTAAATFRASWVLFQYGGGGGTNRHAIDTSIVTGSFLVEYCAFRNGRAEMITMRGASSTAFAVNNNVMHDVGSAGVSQGVVNLLGTPTSTTWTITNNVVTYMPGATSGVRVFSFTSLDGVITGNRAAGFSNFGFAYGGGTIGTVSDNVAHSGDDSGHVFQGTLSAGTLSNLTAYRLTGSGITFDVAQTNPVVLDGVVAFGNSVDGVRLNASVADLSIRHCTVAGDTTFGQPFGLDTIAGNWVTALRLDDCAIGVASGIYVAHSTADIRAGGAVPFQATGRSVALGSTLAISSLTHQRAYIGIEKYGKVAGAHRTVTSAGTISVETSTVDVSPSVKLTPASAVSKLTTNANIAGRGVVAPVASGATVTVTVKVQKDGSYNGTSPRLIMLANEAVGLSSAVVLATCSVSSGSWTTCTGTTASATDDGAIEFIVDCDGTAGNLFVDSWTVGGVAIGDSYWFDGLPAMAAGGGGGGGSSTEHAFTFVN